MQTHISDVGDCLNTVHDQLTLIIPHAYVVDILESDELVPSPKSLYKYSLDPNCIL